MIMFFYKIAKKIITSQHLFVFVTMLVFLFQGNVSISLAQQANYWARQERIPEYYDSTEEPPYLITDQNHVVHAFNSQPLDLEDSTSPYAIYYRQWTLEDGWTTPNDILYYEPAGSIRLVSVVSDKEGVVHLVFQGSDLNLYYTSAYLAEAGSSTAWAEPQIIGEQVTRSGPGFEYIGTIAVDSDANKIVVIYSGSQYGSGLYYVFSTDHGSSWSSPDLVFLTTGDDFVVTDPKLYVGSSGIFHAVWSNFKSDGSAGSGYYASWDPTNDAWSKPIDLDVPGIRTPSIVEYKGDLVVSYYHASTNGNWWRRSSDAGITWTPPVQVSPFHKGTNGGLSFVVDSNNIMHAFFGERIDDNNHGMWHTIWTGTAWSNPEAVVKGPQVKDVIGGNGFDPRSARAVISNGNVVLVAWGTDGAGGVNGAWYSYKRLDTPELPVQPLPVPSLAVQEMVTESVPVMTPTLSAEKIPVILNDGGDEPQSLRSPQTAILIGIIPVILLLLGIIFVRYISHNRK
jgi:hypothetical protein